MADSKPLDSNFFIFLPHVFTSEPVSDIEKGPRYSCFVGELLNFFLIAQFRGKGQAKTEGLREWQTRLLRLSTSVSVSCVDLGNKIDDDYKSAGGFTSCSPVASCRTNAGNKLDEALAKTGSPIITSRGDIVYPLNVSLDVLSALSKRIRLSVNVWTPELNAAVNIKNGLSWDNYLDYFISNDPDDALGDLQTLFRCHVNATLPVVSPPTVRCRYTTANGKHYLAVEVINSLGEPITLHKVNIHSNSSMAAITTGLDSQNHLHFKNKQKSFSFLHALPLMPDEGSFSHCPLILHPWEHSSYLFRIVQQENTSTYNQHRDAELVSSITWSVETLTLRHQKITTRYSLPLFNIQRSSVHVKAHTGSTIERGKRFRVTYTVTNTEDDDCNVLLAWQPHQCDNLMPGMHNIDSDSLVCLQPTIKIGGCPSGSSQAVHAEFLALQGGLHEVGQFMVCKWYSDSEDTSRSKKAGNARGLRGLTTLSHSCQVFVVDDG